MIRWEYYTAPVTTDPYHLGEYGTNGWELVAIYQGVLFFKRPL